MAHELLSATEAGHIVGASAETIRRWANSKRIRHVRLPSGQVRFYRTDLEAILQPVEATGCLDDVETVEPVNGVAP